jgi:acyl-CoA reductase-like NAD-dependent aldehyde dehydrogenase
LFDRILFRDFAAEVWMQPGVNRENLNDRLAAAYRYQAIRGGISLVLGAGNVSSIAATDALSKLFQESKVVLLKMNPVNDYLGPVFEEAFSPLIEPGYLRIMFGGADAGAYAAHHPLVDDLHITGSIDSHDAIIWGPPGQERARRKAAGVPVLGKPITSELGNVTPWIIVPSPYTDRELDFQAENVAAMIVNNASFNCVAAKMIVTQQGWPDRDRFLDKVDALLANIPPRRAYYPGASERFQQFTGRTPAIADRGALPWTLVRGADPDGDTRLFQEESFVCVAAETALEAGTAEDFLDRVADFVNERLWGTLAAGIMVHPTFRQRPGNEARLQRCIGRLNYGTVAINHWPALAFVMMSCPWGGFPGGTLQNPRSGIGWVHNTYMLDEAEKTVLEGPLTIFPKPFWFPTHRRAHELSEQLLRLYHRPTAWKLPSLILPALGG